MIRKFHSENYYKKENFYVSCPATGMYSCDTLLEAEELVDELNRKNETCYKEENGEWANSLNLTPPAYRLSNEEIERLYGY